MSLLETRPG